MNADAPLEPGSPFVGGDIVCIGRAYQMPPAAAQHHPECPAGRSTCPSYLLRAVRNAVRNSLIRELAAAAEQELYPSPRRSLPKPVIDQ